MVELVFRSVSEFLEVSFGLFWLFHWLGVKEKTFIVDHILEKIFCWLEVIPAPIEGLFADDLLLVIMEAVKVGMRQAFLY